MCTGEMYMIVLSQTQLALLVVSHKIIQRERERMNPFFLVLST
jgi:hypothetical protein